MSENISRAVRHRRIVQDFAVLGLNVESDELTIDVKDRDGEPVAVITVAVGRDGAEFKRLMMALLSEEY